MYIAKQSHSDKPFTCGNAGFSKRYIIVVYSSMYIHYHCIFWHGRLQICAHIKSNTHNYIMLSRLCVAKSQIQHIYFWIVSATKSQEPTRNLHKSTQFLHMRKSQPYSRNLHICAGNVYVKCLHKIYTENSYSLHIYICQEVVANLHRKSIQSTQLHLSSLYTEKT